MSHRGHVTLSRNRDREDEWSGVEKKKKARGRVIIVQGSNSDKERDSRRACEQAIPYTNEPRIPILFGLSVSEPSTLQVAKKPCWMQLSPRSRSNSRSHRIPYRKTRLSDGKRLVSDTRTSSQTTRQLATLCLCVPLLIPDQEFILFLLPHVSKSSSASALCTTATARETGRRRGRLPAIQSSYFLSGYDPPNLKAGPFEIRICLCSPSYREFRVARSPSFAGQPEKKKKMQKPARFWRGDFGTRRAPTGFVTVPWLPGQVYLQSSARL